jgi:hypothetical protein
MLALDGIVTEMSMRGLSRSFSLPTPVIYVEAVIRQERRDSGIF